MEVEISGSIDMSRLDLEWLNLLYHMTGGERHFVNGNPLAKDLGIDPGLASMLRGRAIEAEILNDYGRAPLPGSMIVDLGNDFEPVINDMGQLGVSFGFPDCSFENLRKAITIT